VSEKSKRENKKSERRENNRVRERMGEREREEREIERVCCWSVQIVSRTFRMCAPGFFLYISTGNQVHIRIFGTRTWYCSRTVIQYSTYEAGLKILLKVTFVAAVCLLNTISVLPGILVVRTFTVY
jgi:hypothetical protein